MTLAKINTEQELYVLHCSDGYTCLGFKVAERWGRDMAKFAGIEGPKEARGTPEAFAEYERIQSAAAEHARRTGTRDESDLTPQLKGLEGKRVEVIDSHGEKRRFWVGKSMGWRPIHLEVHNTRSMGGPGTFGTPYKSVRVVRERR